MKISFVKAATPKSGTLVVGATTGGRLTPIAAELDEKLEGAITRAVKAGTFKGNKDQYLEILSPHGLPLNRILLVGLGKAEQITDLAAESLGASIASRLNAAGEKSAAIHLQTGDKAKLSTAELNARMALGMTLGGYRFSKYKTGDKAPKPYTLTRLSLMGGDITEAKARFADFSAVIDGTFRTRNVVTEPGNVIYPKSFVKQARELEETGLEIIALDKKQIKKLGMGALMGVAQGSDNDPYVLIMKWNGGAEEDRPVAFVGKGVTFDTGGISIKPAGGMEEMKFDMGGAGTVLGLMETLAKRNAKVNAIGICGLVENMPDGEAQRPGDVVTSLNGQTIEVINTDAEGRLVLADILTHVQNEYNPHSIVDLATLTGAMIIALGHEYAGMFCNDDKFATKLVDAGVKEGELLWRLPLADAYDKMIDSDIADMKNVGSRAAGSITAAQFLQRFIDKGVSWAHLDIAGTAWRYKATPTCPKGASAFGVRLLDRLVRDNYEQA